MQALTDKTELLNEIRRAQNAFKGDFPKKSFRLADAIKLIEDAPVVDAVQKEMYEQVKWERDYLQGFVDEQGKFAKECENYEDKCNYHCLEDMCEFKDKCDACKKSYEHGIAVREGTAKAYAMVYNADKLRGFTKVVHCKDCKHRGDYNCPMYWEELVEIEDDGYRDIDWYEHDNTEDDGFCDRGERKDDET